MYLPTNALIIIGIILGAIIISLTAIFGHIDMITYKLFAMVDNIKDAKTVEELDIIKKELDELPILFRTKRRGSTIIRLSGAIKYKRNKILNGHI